MRRQHIEEDDSNEVLINSLDDIAIDGSSTFVVNHVSRYLLTNGEDAEWNGPQPVLILYTKGRKSGDFRRNPVLYFDYFDRRYIIASNGGLNCHPDWYFNLRTESQVFVRVMSEIYEASARELQSVHRDRIWNALVSIYPIFLQLQENLERRFPIIEIIQT